MINTNYIVLLLEQGMMQVRHEIDYEYKSHNLKWQNWKVVFFGLFLILINGTFERIINLLESFSNLFSYKFILNNILKRFVNQIFEKLLSIIHFKKNYIAKIL